MLEQMKQAVFEANRLLKDSGLVVKFVGEAEDYSV